MESDEEMGAGPSGSREVSMEDEQGEPDGEDEDEDDEMESEDEEARAAARDSLEAKDDDARIQAYEHAKEKRGKIQGVRSALRLTPYPSPELIIYRGSRMLES